MMNRSNTLLNSFIFVLTCLAWSFANAQTAEQQYEQSVQACYNYVNNYINVLNTQENGPCPNGNGSIHNAKLFTKFVPGAQRYQDATWVGSVDSQCGSDPSYYYMCSYGNPPVSSQDVQTQQASISTGTKNPICKSGSVIDVSKKTVSEQIPIARAPFHLNYSSEYNQNRIANRSVQMNYYFPQGTSYQHQVGISSVATGQNIATLEFPAGPFLQTSWVWDGVAGADISNPFLKEINLNVVLNEELNLSGIGLIYGLEDTHTQRLVIYNPNVWGMGGWTPSIHHYFDRVSQTIFWGTGSSSNISNFKTITLPQYGTVDLVVDPAGNEIYMFDSLGRHVETRTAFLGVTKYKFTYDSNNRLANIQDINGGITVFNRDGNGNLTSIQPAMGPATNLTTDSNGNILAAQDPNGNSYSVSYDSNIELTNFVMPDGLATQLTYDSVGNMIREDKNNGLYQQFVESIANLVRSISYQTPVGTLDSYQITDTSGGEQVTHVDGRGRVIEVRTDSATGSVVTGADVSTTTNYSDDPIWGNALPYASYTFPQVSGQNYGPFNTSKSAQLSDPTNPLTLVSSTEVDQHYPSSVTTVMDVPSRTISVTDSTGNTYHYVFDTSERLIQITDDTYASNVVIQYNSLGQLSQYTDNYKKIYQYAYNQNGDLASITELGAVSPIPIVFSYDNNGNILKKTMRNGDMIQYAYTPTGALKQLTTPSGQVYSFQVSLGDIFTQAIAPVVSIFRSTTTSYNYDSQKRIQTVNLPSGRTVSYNYLDGTNYVQSISSSQGSYQYNNIDANGRMSSAASPDGIQSNLKWYGTNIAEEQWIDTDGSVIATLDYNWQLNVLSSVVMSDPSGKYLSNLESLAYDSGWRITQSNIGGGSTQYTYSSPETQVHNINEQSNNMKTTYSWQPHWDSQFTTQLKADNGNQLLVNLYRAYSTSYSQLDGNSLYTYNVNGTSQSLNSVVQEGYSYDADERLTGSSNYLYVAGSGQPATQTYSTSYELPPGSNENIATYSGTIGSTNFRTVASYDAQDRLLQTSGSVNRKYTYDDDGNITSMTNCYGTTTYLYDEFSNLKKVTKPDGTVIEYKVDAFNRRIKKIVNGQTKEYYLWYNDSTLAAVLDQNKSVIDSYSYGPISRTATMVVHLGVPYKILVDPDLGSVRYVVEPGYGQVMQEISYDAYGNMLKNTNPNFQPIMYAGGLFDVDTNLIRFGARDYDPSVGRWMTKDPLGFGGGDTNLYAYVADNPVNNVDPSGLASICTRPLNPLTSQVGPLYHEFVCYTGSDGQQHCGGLGPTPGNGLVNGAKNAINSPGVIEPDKPNGTCKDQGSSACMDNCVGNQLQNFVPQYRLVGSNCQDYAQTVINTCKAVCGGK